MNDTLTVAELCAEWEVTRPTVWTWRKRTLDPLPWRKAPLNGRVQFVRKEVEAWRKRNLETKAVK